MSDTNKNLIDDGKNASLDYILEHGGNTDAPNYQDASGAPVESKNPLGYNVAFFTIIFLNIGQMVGTGIFSTREFELQCLRCLSVFTPYL